ncbi:MAG: hypothetical protein WCG25_07860 [bacterium]
MLKYIHFIFLLQLILLHVKNTPSPVIFSIQSRYITPPKLFHAVLKCTIDCQVCIVGNSDNILLENLKLTATVNHIKKIRLPSTTFFLIMPMKYFIKIFSHK